MLSGCMGELGDAWGESESSGASSGDGDGSFSGAPGSGPSAGSGGSAAAGTGGSDGSGSPAAGGSNTSTTVSSGSTGGSPTGGAGGSDGSGAAPSGPGGAGGSDGAGGSPTGGAGGSDGAGGSPTGGAGGSDGAGGSPTGGAGGSDGATSAAQLCVDTINQHRATLGLPPLGRWTEAEACSDEECESDGNTNTPHGAFGACKERAQNECPGWPGPAGSMIVPCLQLMWDEGPGEDFNQHGHYLNMSNPEFTQVACGFHTFPDGSVWAVQNFR
ncbi:CAP domain-containing protein [Sorangium sp. So ce1335]|uniref:CAP domain-containing protein n=1 Tax=Sorangium sp. So ce1335 TaxID=3133335 RepID=UPI003F6401F5